MKIIIAGENVAVFDENKFKNVSFGVNKGVRIKGKEYEPDKLTKKEREDITKDPLKAKTHLAKMKLVKNVIINYDRAS